MATREINLIWAQGRHPSGRAVIGQGGAMPWHLPEDLAHFKALTLGCPVIMGRKTWESLPPRFQPLPGRTNIVLTRNAAWSENGVKCASSLRRALQICEHSSSVWVIGGAEIYAQALPLATRLEVTEIDAVFEGDAFAPQCGPAWAEAAREHHTSVTGLAYSFVRYLPLHPPQQGV